MGYVYQAAQEEVESSAMAALKLQDFLRYKTRFMKMTQKKRLEELTENEIRKTETIKSVYLGGKVCKISLSLFVCFENIEQSYLLEKPVYFDFSLTLFQTDNIAFHLLCPSCFW